MRIFDGHSHFLPEVIRKNASFYPPVWSDEENLIGFIEKNQIEKTVLLYPTTDASKKMGATLESVSYNEALAELRDKYPEKLIPAFIVPQDSKENMLGEAQNAVLNLKFKALSIPSSFNRRYLDNEFYSDLFAFLEKNKVAIFVHSQTEGPLGSERFFDPLLTPVMQYLFDISACLGKLIMSGTLNKFPNLKFVFAHFGGVIPLLARRFDTTYQMLRGINVVKDLGSLPGDYLKRVYVDTSGVASMNALNCAIETFGIDKIIWGSDFPANRECIASLEMIKMVSGCEHILCKNLEKVFDA